MEISPLEIIVKIIGVFLLIGLNAFFVAVEFAVVASRRTRVDQMARGGGAAVRIVQRWVGSQEQKDGLIAAAQLGITIASLALGYLGEETFQSIVEALLHGVQVPDALSGVIRALPLVISLIVVTSLHVVLGEQVPKVAALRRPEPVALFAATPMNVFQRVFHPFVWLLDQASSGVLRLFGVQPVGGHAAIYTVDELRQIMRESEEQGVLEEEEEHMLQAIFDLRTVHASQVKVPRTEMVCISADSTLEELTEITARTSLTKFPVFEGDLDRVIGVVHIRDMVRHVWEAQEQEETPTLRSLVRETIFLPETVSIATLLAAFRRNRQHIAILLDEYGGTSGLVTLEDLLEEIVGEVRDIFEQGEPTIRWQPDGSALVDGMMSIDEVNETFQLSLRDSHYTSIGGLIMGRLDRVPVVGDKVLLAGGKIRALVEEMDDLRVATVRLVRESGTPQKTATRQKDD
jgi:CBS domain containing-hemolysin-like protein